MTMTYDELKQQYAALRKTFDYLMSRKDEIIGFYRQKAPESMTFIGCGSGYCLCQSGEFAAKTRMGLPAATLAAGDLMLNYESYGKLLEGTMLVAPSRSGSTSEVINAINNVRTMTDVPVLAITCKEDSDLARIADLSLNIPWANDVSVCQTRTVVNLYTALLLVTAFLSGDEKLVEDIDKAINIGKGYMDQYEDKIRKVAEMDWNYVVLLADGEMQGIASEGAIAFTEIAQLVGSYYHVLDVRHGPMVMVNDKTLVIACLSSRGFKYQKPLIQEIVARGAKVITYSDEKLDDIEGVQLNVTSGVKLDSAVYGIPFIFIAQISAYYKAAQKGINPDNPDGIVAWVKL